MGKKKKGILVGVSVFSLVYFFYLAGTLTLDTAYYLFDIAIPLSVYGILSLIFLIVTIIAFMTGEN